jgi:membrane protease YdiL (CAAX protease family)
VTEQQHRELPLWHRVIDFPLVALLVAVALYIIAGALGLFLGKYVSLGAPATGIVQSAITLALVLATYKLIIVRLGKHPRDDLRGSNALPDLGRGITLGAVLFSIVVGIAALVGVYHVAGIGSPADLLVPLVASAIMPGFMEELLFRGILFRWLQEFGGSWAALVITSALFGLAHILNPGATWFSSFAIAVEAGLLLGGAYMLTRSLWMPIGLHAAWNFTQGAIFGVPVSGNPTQGLLLATLSGPNILSGGDFGLEASIIALVVATLGGASLVAFAVRRGEIVEPSWVRRRAPTAA